MNFRYDTRHLSSQVQQIIRERDKNSKSLETSRNKQVEVSRKDIYNISIFMKLTIDITGVFNGLEILKIYKEFCYKNKCVWFSTDALATGMSEKKVKEFLSAIKDDYVVEMYFSVSKNSSRHNDIVYKGEVVDIKSDAKGIYSPDKSTTPNEWKDIKNKIWIKLKDVKSVDNVYSKDFIIASTGNVLSDVISKSQYHFGYIRKKS